MPHAADRPFDWVAAIALVCGAAVILPGLVALVVNLLTVALSVL